MILFYLAVITSLFIVLRLAKGLKKFFLALFAAKPFIDQTVRVVIFQSGGTELNLLAIWGVFVFVVMLYLILAGLGGGRSRIKGQMLIVAFLFLHVFIAGFSVVEGRKSLIGVVELLIRHSTPYLFYFIFVKFLQDEEFKIKIVKTIWLSNFYAILMSIGLYFLGAGNYDLSQGVSRFTGFYGDSATLSLVGFTAIVFSVLYREISGYKLRGWLRLNFYLTLVTYVFIFWITLTKATVLITIAFVLLWWGWYKRRALVIIPLLVLGFVYMFQSSQRVQSRFYKEISFISAIGEEDVSLESARGLGSGRFGRWMNAIDYYKNDYDLSEKLFGTYLTFKSHNQFVSYLMQVGFVGLLIFLAILLQLFKGMFEKHRLTRDPSNFIGLILLVSMVIYGMGYISFSFTTVLWITMAFVGGLNQRMPSVNSSRAV